MDLKLAGKVALVTGASRGIGQAIALRLAEEGMSLALAARDETLLRSTAAQGETGGVRTLVYPADLSQPAAAAAFVKSALDHFGRIDLVVNNAGATKRGDFLALTEQDWTDGFGLKFYASVLIARAAWPALRASAGSMVNIVGVGGRTGNAEFTIGGTVNAALLNLTKCLADRGIAEGVRVNAINPGAILTERLSARIQRLAANQGMSYEEATRHMIAQMGIARFGAPSEVADVVAFLASERAAYLQGAIVDVDGGFTRTL